MLDHVICCVDGSDCSRRATSVGLSLAAAADAAIDVVTVVPDAETDDGSIDELLGPVAAALEEASVDVERHTLVGQPAERIVSFGLEREADLLALGKRGRGAIAQRLLGSTLHAVLRDTDTPVVAVPEATRNFALSDLLVPTDGSDAAARAAPLGATIAAQHDATLHSCYAIDPFTAAGPFNAGGLSPAVRGQYEHTGRDALDNLLDRAREYEAGLATESDVVVPSARGDPGVRRGQRRRPDRDEIQGSDQCARAGAGERDRSGAPIGRPPAGDRLRRSDCLRIRDGPVPFPVPGGYY